MYKECSNCVNVRMLLENYANYFRIQFFLIVLFDTSKAKKLFLNVGAEH